MNDKADWRQSLIDPIGDLAGGCSNISNPSDNLTNGCGALESRRAGGGPGPRLATTGAIGRVSKAECPTFVVR